MYEGDFREDLFHGWGRMRSGNGDLYEGYFDRGKKHGVGSMTTVADGSVYEGRWKRGRRTGKGMVLVKKEAEPEGGDRDGDVGSDEEVENRDVDGDEQDSIDEEARLRELLVQGHWMACERHRSRTVIEGIIADFHLTSERMKHEEKHEILL